MRLAAAADPVRWIPSQRASRRRRAVGGSSVEVTIVGTATGVPLLPRAFETEPPRLGRFCPEQSRCGVARCAAQARSRVRRTLALGAGAKPASSSSGRSARGTRRRLRIDAAYRARAGSRGDVDRLLELQDAISGVLADSYAEQHRAPPSWWPSAATGRARSCSCLHLHLVFKFRHQLAPLCIFTHLAHSL
jgi:hypothetical protein